MDAVDIDWVEIPAGECVVGLSEEQKRYLLRRATRQVGGIRKLFRENQIMFRAAQSLLLSVRKQQRIHLDTFYISRYPVTVEQYVTYQKQASLLVDSANRRTLELGWGRLPKKASYRTATAFCRSLDIRLPTSDEWEKAARGPEGWLYPWGDKWDPTRANVVRKIAGELSEDRPPRGTWAMEVDVFPPGQSAYGVWDLVGNVWEWTSSSREFLNWHNLPVLRRIKRRWPIKHRDELAWLYNVLAMEHPADKDDFGFYTGFRVACDELPGRALIVQ
jgi:formylglycine-generating enzyme required for sulfatase activity